MISSSIPAKVVNLAVEIAPAGDNVQVVSNGRRRSGAVVDTAMVRLILIPRFCVQSYLGNNRSHARALPDTTGRLVPTLSCRF